MAETYDIVYDKRPVGDARMEKQGLYLYFSCRCMLPDEEMYRIHVICGENREDLGICVPMDGRFGTDKKIPAKRLGEGTPAFELVAKDWTPAKEVMPEPEEVTEAEKIAEPVVEELPEPEEERFIPVSEEEPFEYLDKLENAVMEVRDDQPGIVISGGEE